MRQLNTRDLLAAAIVVLLAAVLACLFGLSIASAVHDIINVADQPRRLRAAAPDGGA